MRDPKSSGKKPIQEVQAPRPRKAKLARVSRDIAERKQAEEELKRFKEWLANIINALDDPVFVKDEEHRWVILNDAACEVMGRPREELIGKSDYDLFSREQAEVFWERDELVLKNGQTDVNEEEITWHGKLHTISTKKSVFTDSLTGKKFIAGTIRDITERKKAEEALRESEEKISQIVQENSIATFVIDDKHIITHWNKACENLTGISANEVIGTRKQWSAFYSTQRPVMADLVTDSASEDEIAGYYSGKYRKSSLIELAYEAEDFFPDLGEKGRWLFFTAAPLRDAKGKTISVIETLQDITEPKKAEEKLLAYQGQLKSLASELSLAEERERRRIAVELHDRISQSLVISKVKLEALRESASSAELGKTLDEVCNSLGQTIADTRSLTFDLSSPILYELGLEAAVAEWLTEQIGEKYGIATEFEDDGLPKPLDDDIRILLFRDVRELLTNVVRHADAHKVKVSICKVGSRIRVSVEDDGVGFEPAEVVSMAAETNGFGLFSIRERLEELGGHLEIESERGRGSRITMMAPLESRKNTERR